MLLYYVNRGKSSGLPLRETGPRDIQMVIPLHQLRIPHIHGLEQYLSPSATNTAKTGVSCERAGIVHNSNIALPQHFSKLSSGFCSRFRNRGCLEDLEVTGGETERRTRCHRQEQFLLLIVCSRHRFEMAWRKSVVRVYPSCENKGRPFKLWCLSFAVLPPPVCSPE